MVPHLPFDFIEPQRISVWSVMRRLTLEGIELLDAIARAGSFSGAGVLLNKVTSTVSYSVAKLEGDLEVTLFLRHGPKVELTPAGRELLDEGRVLLQAADDLQCRVKRVADGWENEIRMAVDALIPPLMFGSLFERFCEEAPTTRVKFMSEVMTGPWEALLDGRADVIVAVGQGPSGGGFRSKRLTELQFCFCVAPKHPLAEWKGTVPSEEVRKHRTIVVSDTARHLPTRTVGLLRGQQVLAVPDMRTKYALQVAGLGVGFLPRLFVRSALKKGLLVEKQVEEPKPDDQVLLAWKTSERGKALKWWRDALGDTDLVLQFLSRASQAWVAEY